MGQFLLGEPPVPGRSARLADVPLASRSGGKDAAVALVRTGRPAEAEALLAPHLATHGRDAEAWWLAALCRAADPEAGAIEVAEALERACRLQPSRRDAIGGESAFGPYLTDPAIRALLPSAPVEV